MNKQVKIGLFVCLLLVALIGGWVGLEYYNEQKKIIKEKDPGLTQEDRKIYEDRLIQAREALNNPEATSEQKFNWYMQEGFQLYGLGKYADARNSFLNAIQIHPQDSNPFVALYQVQLDMNDNKGAKTSIKKALDLKPDGADIWKKYISLEMYQMGAGNSEINDLYVQAEVATKNSPSHVDLITSYAQFLEKIGNIQGAIDNWQKVIEFNSANKAIYEQEIERLKQGL